MREIGGKPLPVPAGHLDSVCRMGQDEETCLSLSGSDPEWICLKGSGAKASTRPNCCRRDNCSGPPLFDPAG